MYYLIFRCLMLLHVIGPVQIHYSGIGKEMCEVKVEEFNLNYSVAAAHHKYSRAHLSATCWSYEGAEYYIIVHYNTEIT